MDDYGDSNEGDQPAMMEISVAEWERVNDELRARERDLVALPQVLLDLAKALGRAEKAEAQLAAARAAVDAVEFEYNESFDGYMCPWCYWATDLGLRDVGHAPDCQRQAALAAMDNN